MYTQKRARNLQLASHDRTANQVKLSSAQPYKMLFLGVYFEDTKMLESTRRYSALCLKKSRYLFFPFLVFFCVLVSHSVHNRGERHVSESCPIPEWLFRFFVIDRMLCAILK